MSNLIGLILIIFLQPVSFMGSMEDPTNYARMTTSYSSEHKDWNDLLEQYVDQEGNVNYKGFKSAEATLDRYLDYMANNAPANSASKEEKLVYYINLYNAATVKLVLDHYPVQSIKDIKSPWDKKWISVANEKISLGAIEHKILRKLDEPRIHFAINCASYSCPKLSKQAYTLNTLEEQLDTAARDFINDSKRNRIQAGKAEVSEIFKWFKSDFTKRLSLKSYINQYAKEPIGPDTKLQYIKYDWSLNEIK